MATGSNQAATDSWGVEVSNPVRSRRAARTQQGGGYGQRAG